ncbi:MAG: PIN domain-containing protein [archaeon]
MGELQKVYLDSNVFIAFIKSEIGKPFKLMFQEVEDFFKECSEKYLIVLSKHAMEEIERIVCYNKEDTKNFFKEMRIPIETIQTISEDNRIAREFFRKGIHFADALHVALAVRANCEILLTFNKKDFKLVEGIIKVREPKELIN